MLSISIIYTNKHTKIFCDLNYEHMIYKDVHMMAQCQSGPISTLIQRELSLSSTKYLQNVAKIELVSFSVDMFRSNFVDERLLNL